MAMIVVNHCDTIHTMKKKQVGPSFHWTCWIYDTHVVAFFITDSILKPACIIEQIECKLNIANFCVNIYQDEILSCVVI